jgi:1-acyl-sn-glycerol-3-phosphate acyltransferase
VTAHYPEEIFYNALYSRLVRGFLKFLLGLLSRYEVRGLKNLPDHGPLILAGNHLHVLDLPAIYVALPYRAVVLAAAKYEGTLRGHFLRSLGAIFVRRGEVDRRALKLCLEVLRGGGVLGMSPEGTRSSTGAMQEARTGIAFLAYRTEARIVPVALTGTELILSELRRFRRAKVTVTFGKEIRMPPVSGRASRDDLVRGTALFMRELAAMLPERYRGVYADSEA